MLICSWAASCYLPAPALLTDWNSVLLYSEVQQVYVGEIHIGILMRPTNVHNCAHQWPHLNPHVSFDARPITADVIWPITRAPSPEEEKHLPIGPLKPTMMNLHTGHMTTPSWPRTWRTCHNRALEFSPSPTPGPCPKLPQVWRHGQWTAHNEIDNLTVMRLHHVPRIDHQAIPVAVVILPMLQNLTKRIDKITENVSSNPL